MDTNNNSARTDITTRLWYSNCNPETTIYNKGYN